MTDSSLTMTSVSDTDDPAQRGSENTQPASAGSTGARRRRRTGRRPGDRSRRRPGWTLSARVLTALVVITSLGLVFGGGVAVWVQSQSVAQRVDRALAQEVAELRTLASGVDPTTGQSFASVEALLRTMVERNVPDHNEGFLVTVDGQVPFVPGWNRGLRLEQVPELRQVLASLRPGDPARFGILTSGDRELRYVAVPVQVPGEDSVGGFAVATDLVAERQEVVDTARAYAIAGVLTLLLIAVLGGLVLRRLLRPLKRLVATADRVSEEDLSGRIPEVGADDLVRLTRTINGMLDRLESAFVGQRALLDDVGHELRTPLTVIRGHLEIMDVDDPREVDETRVLALDELDRMGRLVEELVLLAKSERPDFLTRRPVDLDDVVEGALGRARTLADRRWRVDARSGLTLLADDQRLTQAMLQLVSNAVRHTEPDDEVAVGAGREGARARLWVRDTGEGVPAADQKRIFERFERGSGARDVRAGGHGSGLGLSIVSAIAKAHGGQVSLSSMPGAGSTFVLELPLDHPDDTDEQEPSR